MKTNYKGSVVEGSVKEIKELLSESVCNKKEVAEEVTNICKPRKGFAGFTEEQEEYVVRAKKNNVSYINLVTRFNKKFGTNYTKRKMIKRYSELKK